MTSQTMNIRFGTDGWRGIIAEDFTFENVRRVAAAIAAYVQAENNGSRPPAMVIGYDTRFHSKTFADIVADALSRAGCAVVMSDAYLSTPAVSACVATLGAFGGIVISASHNPPSFNGVKFKTSYGGSAPEHVTKAIEQLLYAGTKPQERAGSIETKKLAPLYWKRLRAAADMNLIKRSRLKVVADPMFGAGIGYLDAVLKGTKCQVIDIHDTPDPMFGGLHPEPIEENLADLKKAVRQNGAACGLASDGDADRIGVVDEKGRYLSPHQVFPLLLHYLCKYKKLKGKVVQSISLGYVSERIAKDFGLEWEEVPIGFKYIAERIVKGGVLMGGEESGGYGYGSFLPERDGILNSLMVIEMLAATGKPLSTLLRDVEKKYGTSAYLRTDFVNPGIAKKDFVETLKSGIPDRIAGLRIKEIKDYDGIEFILEDDSWLLLRPSGTEPVIRVYCESPSLAKTKSIISWGHKAVRDLEQKLA